MSAKKSELYRVKDEPRYSGALIGPLNYATDEMSIEIKKVAIEVIQKEVVMRRKPLPQILDEMDDNIRAAAEAARRAYEATKAAIEATGAAAKASAEAEKQGEKLHTKVVKDKTLMLKRIKLLERRLTKIEASLPSEKVIVLREISKKDAEKEIRNLFSKGKTLYYSDIAERLNLDLQLVVKICNELRRRGEIKIDDNALQSG
ncbi:MAG: hypothetical protein A2Z15_09320 [Chloroflexi bacterium RBG_16_50_11]|nr:MAG: hypothetical protein A2Z15_09320 [Chloroflexi bacterium RBG_16_50_11]